MRHVLGSQGLIVACSILRRISSWASPSLTPSFLLALSPSRAVRVSEIRSRGSEFFQPLGQSVSFAGHLKLLLQI